MKSFLTLIALCCAVSLVGCKNNKTNEASPGAMPECKCGEACKKDGKCSENCGAACCKPATASPGAVGEKKDGCCSEAAKTGASMGAVGEKKAGCCTEAAKTGASMGAVGEKKDGCCSGAAKAGASMGAVSEKSGECTGQKTCPVTGKPVG